MNKSVVLFIFMLLLATVANAQVQFMKQHGNAAHESNVNTALDNTGNIYYAFTFTGVIDADPGAATVNIGTAGMSAAAIIKLDNNGNYLSSNYVICNNGTSAPKVSELKIDNYNNTAYLLINLNGNNTTVMNVDPTGTAVNYSSPGTTNNTLVLVRYTNASLTYSKSFQLGGSTSSLFNAKMCVTSGLGQSERVHMSFNATGSFDINPYAGTLPINVTDEQAFIATYDLTFDSFGWFNNIGTPTNGSVTITDIMPANAGYLLVLGYAQNNTGNAVNFNSNLNNYSSTFATSGQSNGFLFVTSLANGFATDAPYMIKPSGFGTCTPYIALTQTSGSNTTFTVYGAFTGTVDFNDMPSQAYPMPAFSVNGDMFVVRATLGSSGWVFNDAKKYLSTNSGTARPISVAKYGSLIVLSGFYTNTFNFSSGGSYNLATASPNNTSDGFITSYDYATLNVNRANRIFSNVNTDNDARDMEMELDASGNVYFADIFNNTTTFYTGNSLTSVGLGDMALVKYASTVIPVQLRSFSGSLLANQQVALNWQIAMQGKIKRFEVEHSTDGKSFVKVGEKDFVHSDYTFTHTTPIQGNNYYRLKMVDVDGTYEYSNIVLVKLLDKKQAITVYPTITTNQVNVGISNKKEAAYTIRITNNAGQLLKSKKVNIPFYATETIDLSAYQSGIYQITVSTENEVIKTTSVIKQ